MNFCPIEEAKSFQRTKITIIYSPLHVPRLFSSICKSVSYLPDGATLILSFHLICSQISGTSHTQVCAGLWVLCEYLITSQVWGVPLRVDMRWRTAASYCQTLRGVSFTHHAVLAASQQADIKLHFILTSDTVLPIYWHVVMQFSVSDLICGHKDETGDYLNHWA